MKIVRNQGILKNMEDNNKIESSVVKKDLNSISYKSDNPKKERFVEMYNLLKGHISDSCQASGISRDTYYRWLNEDSKFAMAVAESEANLNDEMRDLLISKAGSGDLGAIIFYLKKRHPDFKDQPSTLVQNNFYDHVKKELEEFG